MTLSSVAFVVSFVLMGAGALVTVLTKDLSRLVLGFGVFLLGVAAAFLGVGLEFLAVAQVFLYVGGVLVLVLFAVMVIGRGTTGRPTVETRHDVGAAFSALAVFVILVSVLAPVSATALPEPAPAGAPGLAAVLLGPQLVAFELIGAVLLAAVVAVLAIVGGGERR